MMERKEELKQNLLFVHEQINKAIDRSGNKNVKLICVSKTKPSSDIRFCSELGEICFGENKPQELKQKIEDLSDFKINWHMIGTLQSNKIKYVAREDILIHSVDTIKLAKEISDYCIKKGFVCNCLLEVNTSNEETKHGFSEDELLSCINELESMPGISIKGLMTIAGLNATPEENRTSFKKLRSLKEKINEMNDGYNLTELSMGMTHDFEIAIEEGATYIRIGQGIFGARNYTT